MDIKDKVAIIGVGQTKFGDNFEMSYEDMAVDATFEALEDANVSLEQIQAIWLGTFMPEVDGNLGISGASITDTLGLRDIPVTRCANYCATGTDAFRNACMAVTVGQYDVALVLGVEKMRNVGPRESLVALTAGSGHPVRGKGLTAPGMFALHATRYMREYEIDRTPLAHVAVKNHKNGSLNPLAHFRKEITVEKALKAPMICEPLGLFDCCPTTDGGAAAIITRAELAKDFTDDYVLVKGLGLSVGSGDTVFFDHKDDLLGFRSTQKAAEEAYRMAGITDPLREIDVAEVHDCFSITEILNTEDLGFAKPGEGWKFAVDGRTSLEGDIPINPSGGLKSCGHPIGASGVRMIVEVSQHLRNRAGKRQVPNNPKIGLAHNIGGAGSVASVIVLGRP